MAKFILKSKTNISDNLTEYLSDNYKNWRTLQKDSSSPFFQLYTKFLDYLPALKTGAVSLYLYYGFHANNEKGDSWHSIDTIAEKLNVTKRSINNWNKDLCDLGLIYRVRGEEKSTKTYLLPLSDYFIDINTSIDKYLEKYRKDIDGELVAIYHLFQWRKGDDGEYNIPYNRSCFVFEKKYIADNYIDPDTRKPKEYKIRKFVLTNDIAEDSKKIDVDANSFGKQPIYIFDSDILDIIITGIPGLEQSSIIPKGIAITSNHNLKDNKDLIEILSEIRNKEDILNEYSKANLIEN